MRTLLSLLLLVLLSLHSTLAAASGPRGTLVVANGRDNEVFVLVDGKTVGAVQPASETAFRLAAGPRDLEIRNRSGSTLQQVRFVLKPGDVYKVIVAPAKGDLEVRNGSGTTVRLAVDGASVGELAPGAARLLDLKAGLHHVEATWRQLGKDRLLTSEDVRVDAGGRVLLRLAPVDYGLVRVENHTGRDATLLVDGRPDARLKAGQGAEVVTRLGRVSLSLVAEGRTLDATSIAVGAYQDLFWRAEAPRVGDLRVVNPLPMAVVVEDARGRSFTVAARGQALIQDLQVGAIQVEARRTSGEPIARATVSVRPYDVATWTVPTPSTGLVAARNADGRPVSVWVDGLRVANLAPHETERLLVSVGWHRIQVRDTTNRVLLDTRMNVDPFASNALTWNPGGSVVHGETRSSGHTHTHTRPW